MLIVLRIQPPGLTFSADEFSRVVILSVSISFFLFSPPHGPGRAHHLDRRDRGQPGAPAVPGVAPRPGVHQGQGKEEDGNGWVDTFALIAGASSRKTLGDVYVYRYIALQ